MSKNEGKHALNFYFNWIENYAVKMTKKKMDRRVHVWL